MLLAIEVGRVGDIRYLGHYINVDIFSFPF